MEFAPYMIMLPAAASVVPRFGWSAKNPPAYEVRLTTTDLSPSNLPVPTDTFVAKIADKMIGEADSCPRFALIPNAKSILGSAERVREFQLNLSQKVFDRIKTRLMPADDAARYQAVVEYRSPLSSQTGLHYDTQGTPAKSTDNHPPQPFLSLSYGDNQNVNGGGPVVADVRQYFKDKPKGLLGSLASLLGSKKEASPWVCPFPMQIGRSYYLRPKDEAAAQANYTLRFPQLDLKNDMAIILFNNMFDGVFHAGEPVSKIDESQPAKRPLGLVRFYDPDMRQPKENQVAKFIKGESNDSFFG